MELNLQFFGGRGSAGGKSLGGAGGRLSQMSDEQLDKLYESAAASKDRDLMKDILTELASRPQQENSREIVYKNTDIRRRGARGRK